MNRIVMTLVAFALLADPLWGQQVHVRVADVGAGLCAVVVMPEDRFLIYDGGNFVDNGNTCESDVKELIPSGQVIDLLVLSHSDSDHLAAVPDILRDYQVLRIIQTGFERPGTATWERAVQAVADEVSNSGAVELNFANVATPESLHGLTMHFGEVAVTLVAGWHEPPESWGLDSNSEQRNAVSIVIRLEYRGKSVLFTGDSVGRHIGDPPDSIIAAEQYMVSNASRVQIDSDVLIAAHHGADNGSSSAFIAAVSPEFVIFSAGSKFNHPRQVTAERYLNAGVDIGKIFRTDLGDNEGGTEWSHGSTQSRDPRGDDDVDIRILADGTVRVGYK